MNNFRIKFEWEESPCVRVAELDATWARLEICAGDEPVTKVEAERTQSVRDGIYVPLYPIAEWAVANWWLLWYGYRMGAHRAAGSLYSAREGFALPKLSFSPKETKVELHWSSYFARSAGVRFLSNGSDIVAKECVVDEFRRLVEAVLDRLHARGLHSYIAGDWRAIKDAENDRETRSFCERAARLGFDPFGIDGATASQIESLGSVLPEAVLDDFCDVIGLAEMSEGAAKVGSFVELAASESPLQGRWSAIRSADDTSRIGKPWQDGYTQARTLRARLGLKGSAPTSLEDYFIDNVGSMLTKDFAAPDGIDAISVPGATSAPVFGLPPDRYPERTRFFLCRALGDYLSNEQPSLITRAKTERQQRNRAFAAEFLAPSEMIRNKIHDHRIGDEEIDELARDFQVSDYVIRHQIHNHNLAMIAA